MGKYIRKCRGRGAGTTSAPAVVVAGVRTRSRTAAAASAPAPKRPRKTRAEVEADKGREDDGPADGCCYLQLRSRRLFMVVAEVATASPREPVRVAASAVEEEEAEASPALPPAVTASPVEAPSVAGFSRCSSTASSVEAHQNCSEESSVSDSGNGRDGEWREATPSSRAPGDLSDQESSMSSTTVTTMAACRARMPPAEEIEEFFAAAEKAEAERFAAKYNFDVVRGVPLDAGGRFEWTPVMTIRDVRRPGIKA